MVSPLGPWVIHRVILGVLQQPCSLTPPCPLESRRLETLVAQGQEEEGWLPCGVDRICG